jgi:hypothetical protein
MVAITTLRSRIEALERAIGDRGTRIVITGGLPEGAQTPRNPTPEPEPSRPAEPSSEGCANKPN